MNRFYAVLGLGSFGSKVAMELAEAKYNVVAVDIDRERVLDIKDKVTEAIIADVSNPEHVKELSVRKFDAVIIGLSSHFEDMVLALTLVKQEGARKVIVKANTPLQKRILLRLGADEVIQPDQDVAERLSKRLAMDSLSDMLEFKGSFIAEVTIPEEMDNKTIRELDLRNRFNIIVLLVKKPGRALETVWNPDMVLNTGDHLTVFGQDKMIMEVFRSRR